YLGSAVANSRGTFSFRMPNFVEGPHDFWIMATAPWPDQLNSPPTLLSYPPSTSESRGAGIEARSSADGTGRGALCSGLTGSLLAAPRENDRHLVVIPDCFGLPSRVHRGRDCAIQRVELIVAQLPRARPLDTWQKTARPLRQDCQPFRSILAGKV